MAVGFAVLLVARPAIEAIAEERQDDEHDGRQGAVDIWNQRRTAAALAGNSATPRAATGATLLRIISILDWPL